LAKTNSGSLNLALVRDEFDVNMLDENLDNDQHVDENDESSSSESDEENMQPLFDIAPDVPVYIGEEGNESNMPHSAVGLCDVPTSSHIDWRSYYTDEELRALKLKHINLQEYPNHKGISHIESAVCDNAIVDDEWNPRVREKVKKGKSFYVVKSNKDIWYIIRCNTPCL
jgi:hypothetical protein